MRGGWRSKASEAEEVRGLADSQCLSECFQGNANRKQSVARTRAKADRNFVGNRGGDSGRGDLPNLAPIRAVADRDLVASCCGSLALGFVAICRGDRGRGPRGKQIPTMPNVRVAHNG